MAAILEIGHVENIETLFTIVFYSNILECCKL